MRDQHKCKITFRPQTAVWTTFSQWSVIDIFDLNLLFIHMLSTTFLYDLNKDSYILDL